MTTTCGPLGVSFVKDLGADEIVDISGEREGKIGRKRERKETNGQVSKSRLPLPELDSIKIR